MYAPDTCPVCDEAYNEAKKRPTRGQLSAPDGVTVCVLADELAVRAYIHDGDISEEDV